VEKRELITVKKDLMEEKVSPMKGTTNNVQQLSKTTTKMKTMARTTPSKTLGMLSTKVDTNMVICSYTSLLKCAVLTHGITIDNK
jgi:hypothetical protein